MPRTTIDLTDYELHMPNGQVLSIVSGDLDVTYSMQSPEPDIGMFDWFAEWDVACQSIWIVAMDENESEICLELSVRHPAMRKLMSDNNDRISSACSGEDSQAYYEARGRIRKSATHYHWM